MLKIRRPLGRLIFNMGIAIPGKTVFLIETAPRSWVDDKYVWDLICNSCDIWYVMAVQAAERNGVLYALPIKGRIQNDQCGDDGAYVTMIWTGAPRNWEHVTTNLS